MHIAYITIRKDDKIIKHTETANTPSKIHDIVGKYLARQFSGEIEVLEYLVKRA
jgi:hypothetical protein